MLQEACGEQGRVRASERREVFQGRHQPAAASAAVFRAHTPASFAKPASGAPRSHAERCHQP